MSSTAENQPTLLPSENSKNGEHYLRPVWRAMKARCHNPRSTGYAKYGAKGIRVCDRWHTFENFLADMGDRPEGMTIERVDSTEDYTPENCMWADYVTQNRNRRHNKNNTTGVRNVHRFRTKFRVKINGVYHGDYETVEKAAAVVRQIKLDGGSTIRN